MRNFTFTLLLSLAAFLVSCGPTVEQAIKYNDDIIDKNDVITTKLEELIGTYDKFIPEEMDKAYSEALAKTQEGVDFATKLQAFDDDASFKDGAIELFNAYKSVLEVEHKRIIELLKLDESDYGEEEVAEFDELIESANEKVDLALDKLILVQEKFSERHQFDIIDE